MHSSIQPRHAPSSASSISGPSVGIKSCTPMTVDWRTPYSRCYFRKEKELQLEAGRSSSDAESFDKKMNFANQEKREMIRVQWGNARIVEA